MGIIFNHNNSRNDTEELPPKRANSFPDWCQEEVKFLSGSLGNTSGPSNIARQHNVPNNTICNINMSTNSFILPCHPHFHHVRGTLSCTAWSGNSPVLYLAGQKTAPWRNILQILTMTLRRAHTTPLTDLGSVFSSRQISKRNMLSFVESTG